MMKEQFKEFEIPFGAKDSELCGWEYTIPEGMEAAIVDNKIVVKKKESEDEQHRKWILEYLYDGLRKSDEQFFDHFKSAIAWFEKQGEKKPVNIDYISGIRQELLDIENNAENIVGLTESQWVAIRAAHRLLGEYIAKEQKPAVLIPKFKVGDVMRTLQEAADNITDGLPVVVSIDNEYYRCNNEIIAIKDQDKYEYPPMNRKHDICDSCDEHKPAWSEEDETKIKSIIALLKSSALCAMDGNKGIIEENIKYLKSLKERYTWKPSGAQMKQLGWIAEQNKDNMIGKELMTLYNDLKKLRGE